MCKWSVNISSLLGDLKESPSLGESSHVMFTRMAKYSSLTAFYTFSEQQPKAMGFSIFYPYRGMDVRNSNQFLLWISLT